ncbi:MAG: type II toxin-antitoxin system VapC family toxin, partial [Polyangiales bacterium]
SLEALGYTLLPITPEDALAYRNLPIQHRSPFDRMLVVQAALRGLTLMTHDEQMRTYDVPLHMV